MALARARGHDAIAPRRRPVALEPRQVVAVVVHRVVGDVDDVVAERRAPGERRADAWDALRRAVDDAIEIDEEEHGAMLPSGHASIAAPIPSLAARGDDAPAGRRDQPPLPDGRAGAAPPAAIIGRMRAAIPGSVTIDLVFDGVATASSAGWPRG